LCDVTKCIRHRRASCGGFGGLGGFFPSFEDTSRKSPLLKSKNLLYPTRINTRG
jgi:hypothetical protein